jgi:hypothetical protein
VLHTLEHARQCARVCAGGFKVHAPLAASIMGDFLFGEWNRFGGGLGAYAFGPTLGDAEKVLKIYAAFRDGDNPAGEMLRFAKAYTPFSGMFHTKLAIDYLFWNTITEMANPGYLRRMERRLKKDQGIEFLRTPFDARPSELQAF